MQRIYFDNAASTPLLPEVIEAMHLSLKNNFGNPSSIHFYGRNAKAVVESARKNVAESFNCSIGEIFFTSCATESNNLVIQACIENLNVKRIISSQLEHPCVLNAINKYKDKIDIIWLDVDHKGNIDIDQLSHLLDSEIKTLVSLMYVNNEIGSILPIKEVAQLCKTNNVLFHSDTVQAIGKLKMDLQEIPIDFISASAHKFHGPKGVGFIYINSNNIVKPLFVGGAQERNMRAGTENITGIVGLSKALELSVRDMDIRRKHITELKVFFYSQLKEQFPKIKINGDLHDGIFTILNVSFPADEFSEMIMFNLDINGICASAGSACSSGIEHDSPVMEAIGHDLNRKAIRFSFSHLNTVEEVDIVMDKIKSFIKI